MTQFTFFFFDDFRIFQLFWVFGASLLWASLLWIMGELAGGHSQQLGGQNIQYGRLGGAAGQGWMGGGGTSSPGLAGQLAALFGQQMAAATTAPAQGMASRKLSETNKDLCRDWGTQKGCSRGQACRFAHPPGQGKMGPGKDCSFWLAGSCHFSEEYCNKGAHIEAKRGTRPYKAARILDF